MSARNPRLRLDENLTGALEVMLGREKGMQRIDTSVNGFWTSLFGLLLAGLIDASVLSARYSLQTFSPPDDPPSKLWFILSSLFVALIAYGASLQMLYSFCRNGQQEARFVSAIIVHNWAAPIVSLAVLPLVFLSAVPQGSASQFGPLLIVGVLGLLSLIGVRLIRISLKFPLPKAILCFAMSTIISIAVTEVLEAGLGFSARL